MKLYNWETVECKQMGPLIARRVINSERMTIARIYIKEGGVVPRHHHENEQVTQVLEGRLRFVFDNREIIVSSGDVVEILPNEPHEVIALEDSMALDTFQPLRSDWLSGDDAYLRTSSEGS
jgi:quercetin dioxygenase-like cupin family protein